MFQKNNLILNLYKKYRIFNVINNYKPVEALNLNKLLYTSKKFKSQLYYNRNFTPQLWGIKVQRKLKINKHIINYSKYNKMSLNYCNYIDLNTILISFFFFIPSKNIFNSSNCINIYINKKNIHFKYCLVGDLIEFCINNNFLIYFFQKYSLYVKYTFLIKKKLHMLDYNVLSYNKIAPINYIYTFNNFIYLGCDYKSLSIYIYSQNSLNINKFNLTSWVSPLMKLYNWKFIN